MDNDNSNTSQLPPAEPTEDRPLKDLTDSIEIMKAPGQLYADYSGGFSDVYIGHYTDENKRKTKVAIKILRVTNDQSRMTIEKARRYYNRETRVWHPLDHPNVLKFLGVSSVSGKMGIPALISPFCNNGTVSEYLENNKNKKINRILLLKGVARGLKYLHSKDVIHGDIKPTNILIDDKGNPLLGDFGRSKILLQTGFTTVNAAGVRRYQAIELILPGHVITKSPGPTKQSDVYAFGLTSYQILTDLQPYYEHTTDTGIILCLFKNPDERPKFPESGMNVRVGTKELWPMLEKCWKTGVDDRPSAKEVYEFLSIISGFTSSY